jgi:hypothetical protein
MKAHHLLIERQLLENPVYKDFYRVSRRTERLLTEAQLNAQQIDAVFRAVADGAAKGLNTEKGEADMSSNRTMLGKGTDAVSALKAKFDGLVDYISKSGPVSGFDVAFDQLQGSILNAMGGDDGKVGKAIMKYRQYAAKHPVAQGFILAALGALAGAATGGGVAALAAVGFGIKSIDGLLKGDKASQAFGRGLKGAAIGALAGAALNSIGGANAGPTTGPVDPNINIDPNVVPNVPDIQTHVVQPGETMSGIAKQAGVSVNDIRGLNPDLVNAQAGSTAGQMANPDVLPQGYELKLPPANGSDVYAGGGGTNASTMADIAKGNVPNSPISQRMSLRQDIWSDTPKSSSKVNEWFDRQATVNAWMLSESLGEPRGGVYLTEAGIVEIFRRVDEGIWDSIKSGASKVGGALGNAAKAGWNSATNKITYEKLGMEWRKLNQNRLQGSSMGMVADSADVLLFLRDAGVEMGLINLVYGKMGIPVTTQRGAEMEKTAKTAKGKKAAAAAQAATTTATTAPAAKAPKAAPATSTSRQQRTAPTPADMARVKATTPTTYTKPAAFDYSSAAKMATSPAVGGTTPAPALAATPNYAQKQTGYASQTTTMKPPVQNAASAVPPVVTGQAAVDAVMANAKANAAKANAASQVPSTGQLGPQATGTTNKEFGKSLDPSKMTQHYQDQVKKKVANSSRVHGGKYIREGVETRLMKEFELFLSQVEEK